MTDPATCPHCGRQSLRWEHGFREGRTPPAHSRPEGADRFACRSSAGESLDRLMNWVVGTLLVAFIAALLVVQAAPPR
jgi:hypothetical protein